MEAVPKAPSPRTSGKAQWPSGLPGRDLLQNAVAVRLQHGERPREPNRLQVRSLQEPLQAPQHSRGRQAGASDHEDAHLATVVEVIQPTEVQVLRHDDPVLGDGLVDDRFVGEPPRIRRQVPGVVVQARE